MIIWVILLLFLEKQNKIIIMNKEEYLSFFNNNPSTQTIGKIQSKSTHCNRPKTSHYSLSKTKKLLPHIIEEYQYRITNQLLSQKINHPKRDKIIAQSFSLTKQEKEANSKKKICRKGKKQKENKQQKTANPIKPEGSHLKRSNTSQIERLYKTFDDLNSTCNNYKNDYLISLQNNRMGKRLINTRSMVQDILTKTYYTYQIYNGKIVNRDKYLRINRNSVKFRSCNKNFGKINNGIKCFFQNVATQDEEKYENQISSTINGSRTRTMHESSFAKLKDQNRQINMNHHGFQTNNPPILQTYGNGDLNFVINKIFIQSNPPLKKDTILQVQIIQKDQNLSRILNNYYAQKNNFVNSICSTQQPSEHYSKDCHITASFPYQYISSECSASFGLKFRIHYRNHIYLRIIKAEGLDQREIGVIRLSLQPFKKRQANQFPFKIIKQIRKINGTEHYRQIFESECLGNLYRFKKGEISTTIRFTYQLYFSGFKRYKPTESQQQQIINE